MVRYVSCDEVRNSLVIPAAKSAHSLSIYFYLSFFFFDILAQILFNLFNSFGGNDQILSFSSSFNKFINA